MAHHCSPPTDIVSPNIAIIGGGLTGLFTATLLERAFDQNPALSNHPRITVFEKSRSVGRLATRYRSDSATGKHWQWSFGAQFFTVKTARFQQFIEPWLEMGLLQPWCAQVVDLTPVDSQEGTPNIEAKEQWDTDHARYISTPKMTSWGRALADNLQHTVIQFKTRVAPLSKQARTKVNQKTELFDDAGKSLGQFDWVICTAPNVQTMELMADSGFSEYSKIMQPKMLACYTLMLGWDNVEQLPEALHSQSIPQWDVAYVNSKVVDRVFIEHQKPSHDLLPSVTIHARNEWSEMHVDEDIETVKEQIMQIAKLALNWDKNSVPSQTDCHRWRYAATVMDTDNQALGILVDEQRQWIVSGDWCGRGNIESCYQVAAHTAAAIVKAQY